MIPRKSASPGLSHSYLCPIRLRKLRPFGKGHTGEGTKQLGRICNHVYRYATID
ncbi:MAG: hypothetical protein AAF483_13275 [Planctomycetota bacterium]